ncbi:hypothetical protein FHR83_007074 [Actinoplanes campanulatus]|uniref:Uncharacterized protein n=1 Tax=Actinoplanes campanulatus TaxID=113559 RepID=A0A7W5FI56_9ACTN|nr:hypothetical protein [Actinoplanes campanulatus]MBB3099368.1 hypothetical protein [Actinoplanes campanulatus]GGN40263.1 hypothetical protein GCM10010109_69180 [Actinoplanes campanulatus]GID42423.1 hypothetical protein Aca09nite_89290 [Actinoplanes campanulatus]
MLVPIFRLNITVEGRALKPRYYEGERALKLALAWFRNNVDPGRIDSLRIHLIAAAPIDVTETYQ